MRKKILFLIIIPAVLLCACRKVDDSIETLKPAAEAATIANRMNIIIILEDDIGYEIPTCDGGQSYTTPQMDMLAAQGMKFTHCYASAMCSPSRVMLLTGKYGFRNYHEWGILDTTQKTIANMLRERNYETCVSGKWQLDGGNASIRKFGFNKYCVFDPFTELDSSEDDENRYRYKDPVLYQSSAYLPDSATNGKFSDDIFADYATSFIQQNKKNNFFLYFSFSECHMPFFPPPNNPRYATYNPATFTGNITFFPYMVSYMDGKINNIIQAVNNAGVAGKTYIFILADNGTSQSITSVFNNRMVTGGKGNTTEFGLHVPLIVLGPNIQPGSINKNIIDFSDFLPTIAALAKIPLTKLTGYGTLDGKSFSNQLSNPGAAGRATSYGYFFPYSQRKWEQRIYVHDTAYKLYDKTNHNYFFNLQTDSLEQHPIPDNQLTPQEAAIKSNFKTILAGMHN